jgi:hypothetical protein
MAKLPASIFKLPQLIFFPPQPIDKIRSVTLKPITLIHILILPNKDHVVLRPMMQLRRILPKILLPYG